MTSTECKITSFKITISGTDYNGVIKETDHTVKVTVPYGTTVTSLTPTIAVSTGATISPTSGTAQNFSSSVTYTVTAEDTTTTQAYTASVIVAEPTYDTMVEHNINAAGWYKVKKVTFKEFKYETNGFIPAYRLLAVLAVNVPGGITGYVYTDTSGSAPVQRVKLYAGSSEVSNNTRITGDMLFLLE